MVVIAIILICIAHYIRTLRWELFIKSYEETNRSLLLLALSLGYSLNLVIPFKMGDFVRAVYAGKHMKNGMGFALATVIIDRYLDILVVGMLFAIFSFTGIAGSAESLGFYVFSAGVVLLITALIYWKRSAVKKIIKAIAGIFNTDIEIRILRFCWALIWNFKDMLKKINKGYLILTTFGMWALYLLSYFCFADFLSAFGETKSGIDIFFMLFAKGSIDSGGLDILSIKSGELLNYSNIGYLFYLMIPIAFLFLASALMGKKEKKTGNYVNLLPQMDEDEKRRFLEIYFSDEQRDFVQNYLKINRDVLIIRDYSAGSNATTLLCMKEGKNFFRKYAFGSDGDKLYQQIKWLQEYNGVIPLPEVLCYSKEDEFCYYDMPYDSSAVGLFNYAHSMPKSKAWQFVRQTIECLDNSLYQIHTRKADRDTIEKYIESKVVKNINTIMNAKHLKALMEYEELCINGKMYKNLPYFLKYLEKEKLVHIFENDTYSEIHGDLTIENIICTRDGNGVDDFYIIDPNTENIHSSSNLDYAKLLQSIHGGYEFLMATKKVEIAGNHINFVFTKSEAYSYLYRMLDAYMTEHFDKNRIRSIYYHEIIHWLRLMPYKIEKNGKRVLLFYAGMLMVMNDVVKKFEEQE